MANMELDSNAPFIAIPRVTSAETKALRQRALHAAGVIDQPASGTDFYLAINKKELGSGKWFLSSYLKQYFPGGVAGGAARSMGTRVVSFQTQNGKLFVFDTDSRKESSDVFNPDVLVDAYPIVSYSPFDRLPGSTAFVLFDPAAGLNDFAVLGDAFAGGSQPVKFSTELNFLSSYRSLTDGITFEQTFSGYADQPLNDDYVEPNAFRASGTLGIGLRRYAETSGFTPPGIAQIDGQDLWFRGDISLVPNQGFYTQDSIKWAVSATQPINWVISDVVDVLQKDPAYAGYDIYGALSKGITGWNSVFGYDALKVRKGTKSDNYAQDDTNYVIVDTDPSFGAAFANWRINPNTGEIRGASVYINSLWLEIADIIFDDDPIKPLAANKPKPKMPLLLWRPGGALKDACVLWPSIYKDSRPKVGEDERPGIPVPKTTLLTKKEKVEQYLTHVLLHEVGHTLGLRHNFKGSLKFDPARNVYTSSVMEYIDDNDAIFASVPQSYDIDAIKLLYGLSTKFPTDKFCNDDGTAYDADCATFDRTADPLNTTYVPGYTGYLKNFLDGKSSVSPNSTLNGVLDWVRDGNTAAQRLSALTSVWDQAGYSLRSGKADATKLATIPGFGQRTDFMSNRLVSRLFLDDESLRGNFTENPTDPAIVSAVYAEAKLWIQNKDGIRSATTRRTIATWLKQLQTVDAYNALAIGAAELDGEILAGKITDPTELVLATDALKYMDKLMNPYFN